MKRKWILFCLILACTSMLLLSGCCLASWLFPDEEETEQVATPTFLPAEGTYTSSQNVSITCATSGAVIHYTTDGTTPTTDSPEYDGAFEVSVTTTVQALAVHSDMDDSEVGTAAYTIEIPQVSTPVITPATGTYTSIQTVSITCATVDADIYYTTDGTTPTTGSTLYSAPFNVYSTTQINALAVYSEMIDSDVQSADYTFSGWVELFSDDFSSALNASDWSGAFYGSASNTADIDNGMLTGFGDLMNLSDSACSNMINRDFPYDNLRIEFKFTANESEGEMYLAVGNAGLADSYLFAVREYSTRALEISSFPSGSGPTSLEYTTYAGIAVGTEYIVRIYLDKPTNQLTIRLYNSAGDSELASAAVTDSTFTDLTKMGFVIPNADASGLSDVTNTTVDDLVVSVY